MSNRDDRLSAIRAMVERATKGPWGTLIMPYRLDNDGPYARCVTIGDFDDESIVLIAPGFETQDVDNADFAAAARDDVPYLLTLLDKAREDAMEEAAKVCEAGVHPPIGSPPRPSCGHAECVGSRRNAAAIRALIAAPPATKEDHEQPT